MMHEPRLTGVDHTLDHSMTANYTPDILSSYPSFQNEVLEP